MANEANFITDADAGKSTGGLLAKRYHSFDIITAIVRRLSSYYSRAKSLVYDTVIVSLTEKWYRAVLQKLDDGSILLDVGVGTGGGLLRCADLIESKNLKVVGIDIDAAYVDAGKTSIRGAHLSDKISIDKVDVYDGKQKILDLAMKLGATLNSDGQFVDAVYFSGSFSLLPDPVKAIGRTFAGIRPRLNFSRGRQEVRTNDQSDPHAIILRTGLSLPNDEDNYRRRGDRRRTSHRSDTHAMASPNTTSIFSSVSPVVRL